MASESQQKIYMLHASNNNIVSKNLHQLYIQNVPIYVLITKLHPKPNMCQEARNPVALHLPKNQYYDAIHILCNCTFFLQLFCHFHKLFPKD